MGGIGKTVLAESLVRDDVVQQAFPDGIVWITARRETKRAYVEQMREVARGIGDDLNRDHSALACQHAYRTAIAGKAALIIVDDVWSKSDIEPFLAESRRSRLLFTTRDASIGRFVGARQQTAELLGPAESRQLLAAWAGYPDRSSGAISSEQELVLDQIIAECGGLPLALSLIGAVLRDAGPEAWIDTLDLLRKADLSAIEEQLPPGQGSFFKAVEVSFRRLPPLMQQRYRILAVVLENMSLPVPILQVLWHVTEAEARRTARYFTDKSLGQPDATGTIRLHDLQLDYVRAQYSNRQALELIHRAIMGSSHVINKDASQFSSQVIGRLLSHHSNPAIQQFIEWLTKGKPGYSLLPLRPNLHEASWPANPDP